MSTVSTPSPYVVADCPWCNSKAKPLRVASSRANGFAVICQNDACASSGPVRDTEAGAVGAWNAVRMFGRVGIVHGKPGVPNHTTAMAEHLRLLSEQVAIGVYDAPDGYIVIFVSRQGVDRPRVHASTHNIDAAGVARVCEQVQQSASVRNAIKRIGSTPQ